MTVGELSAKDIGAFVEVTGNTHRKALGKQYSVTGILQMVTHRPRGLTNLRFEQGRDLTCLSASQIVRGPIRGPVKPIEELSWFEQVLENARIENEHTPEHHKPRWYAS